MPRRRVACRPEERESAAAQDENKSACVLSVSTLAAVRAYGPKRESVRGPTLRDWARVGGSLGLAERKLSRLANTRLA